MALLNSRRRLLLLIADGLLFAGVVVVGYLQSRHINAGFWTNYGADIIGPVWLYSCFRQLKIYKRQYPSPELTAGFVFAACFLWESCQRYDFQGTILGVTRGFFDLYDILSYGLSLAVAYGIDRGFQWSANRPAKPINDPR